MLDIWERPDQRRRRPIFSSKELTIKWGKTGHAHTLQSTSSGHTGLYCSWNIQACFCLCTCPPLSVELLSPTPPPPLELYSNIILVRPAPVVLFKMNSLVPVFPMPLPCFSPHKMCVCVRVCACRCVSSLTVCSTCLFSMNMMMI